MFMFSALTIVKPDNADGAVAVILATEAFIGAGVEEGVVTDMNALATV